MSKKNKKFKKSLKKNIKKLEKELYENNKYVSREEFIVSKFSKPVKRYYNSLTEERKKAFVQYIIKQEDYEREQSLEKYATVRDDSDYHEYKMKPAKNLAGVLRELEKKKKYEKKRAKKLKNILKGSKGLLYLLNPEAYDQTLLSKKDYRKYLKKLVEEEKKDHPVELDCTLKNFHKELMKNESVNEAVMDAFWGKEGFFNTYGY
jgi:hypothetical protein